MSKDKTEKVTIRIREGDADYLSQVFRHKGYNAAMRSIISHFVDSHKEQAARTIDPSIPEIKL